MTAVVIPSLGTPVLGDCLDAVAELDPPPSRLVLVVSGVPSPPSFDHDVDLMHSEQRLGFAAAANAGIRRVLDGEQAIALLNDDALPSAGWLGRLEEALEADPALAAVQGTVSDRGGELVDGRGITLDRWALPVQVDRGSAVAPEPAAPRPLLAVSATAALFRAEALRRAALAGESYFDEGFGSYHEDLDLGLRLSRLGWRAGWTPGAPCRHRGSSSGARLRWRHPWWLLANRWRALAGNLRPAALIASLPRLVRGDLRAVGTLLPANPRTAVAAAALAVVLPLVVASAWMRSSAGPRLARLPEPSA